MPDATTWKKLSIYQLLTDRFARTAEDEAEQRAQDDSLERASPDAALRKYRGGTWKGIIEKLDYIQGMGFDAIWISPIIKNIEGETYYGEAYHGYWPQNFFILNRHFGYAADLRALSDALHARGMFLMVDIVVNHMGPPPPIPPAAKDDKDAISGSGDPGAASSPSTSTVAVTSTVPSGPVSSAHPTNPEIDFTKYSPFNSATYFHPQSYITDYNDQAQCENGWLGDSRVPLPDLDTENPLVARTLQAWIKSLVQTFKIDGLRLDTVKHVPKPFWPGFVRAADVWCVGEVLSGDPAYLAGYQKYVGGLLDYAAYYPLKRAFLPAAAPGLDSSKGKEKEKDGGSGGAGDMTQLAQLLTSSHRSKFADPQQMATFMENHDMPRFTHDTNSDPLIVMNALAWTFLTDGIPILYYGQEQGFHGDGDPGSRECFWPSKYDTSTPIYKFVGLLNKIRKSCWVVGFGSCLTSALYADKTVLATQRGPVLMVLSNLGGSDASVSFSEKKASTPSTKTHTQPPTTLKIQTKFPAGTILVNAITLQSVQVGKHGFTTFPHPSSSINNPPPHPNAPSHAGKPGIYIPLPLAESVFPDEVIQLPPDAPVNMFQRILGVVGLDERTRAEKKIKGMKEWRVGELVGERGDIIVPEEKLPMGEVFGPSKKERGSVYSIYWEGWEGWAGKMGLEPVKAGS